MELDPRGHRPRQFRLGLTIAAAANLTAITVVVYLPIRDTSTNRWETLTIAALAALVCLLPPQLAGAAVTAAVNSRTRPAAAGVALAAALAAVILTGLVVWGNLQAIAYGRTHGQP